MNTYHATPYDISATGFYFSALEEYREKSTKHRNRYGHPVEEYEIQFIDGDNAALFVALDVNQATLPVWFDQFEEMEPEGAVKAIYLISNAGYSIEAITSDLMDDVMLFEGTAEEYAEQHIESCGLLKDLPENLRYYFDYQAFARDLLYGGDIAEIGIDGKHFVVWGIR